ncbi:MAG TPA: hypothetical protein PLQ76_04135, partial [bacterium]|nr:hypothetical protein [bacterium]
MRKLVYAVFAMLLFSVPCSAKPNIKYALAVYHYNLQYVAGDSKVEGRIIKYGFDPMLDFFLRHPNWGGDLEMQGYMLDALAERAPETLEKLRTLANRGQIDVVSFHYSDQLFLAYPAHDMYWSARLNDEAFKRHNVKRSNVVFTQEGQYGEGMAPLMKGHGQNILILPKNLYRYWQGEQTAAPYYKVRGAEVMLSSRDVKYDDEHANIDVHWTFCDDGELLPTNRATPYSEHYQYRPEAMAKYESELEALEKDGYRIGKISDYMREVKAAGVQPSVLKAAPDGTWQPDDTENVFRWMGDHVGQHERDYL